MAAGDNKVSKRLLYVGGLAEEVNEKLLHSAFIVFGDITDVSIPLDTQSGKTRGFGFVEFEEADDAEAAMDNMNDAELCGRVLKVNRAKPLGGVGGDKFKPVWADLDQFVKEVQQQQAEQDAAQAAAAVEDTVPLAPPLPGVKPSAATAAAAAAAATIATTEATK